MATQTLHYHLTKPASADRVAVGDMNDNSDTIDGYLFQANERADQLADDYNPSSTYNVGDYVRRENYIYKCNTASTTGVWDSTKWDRIMITDELGGGGGSSTLAGLNDVNISSPTDGQALVYDNATQKWVNGAGGGGSSTFAGLNDVDVAGVADKDIARYNSTTQKWEKSSDLTDLELAVSQISASTLGITDGHTILDSNGTAMAQEDGLQFASGCVEDDPVNGKTVYIEMIRISQANYNTLKANGQLKPGAKYFIYDAQPVAVNASNLPYSSSLTTKQAIDSKPNEYTLLVATTHGVISANIPSGAKELYVKIRGQVDTNVYLSFVFNILTATLTSAMEYIGNGFYRTNADYSHCTVYLNKDSISRVTITYNGGGIPQYTEIYYR